MLAAFSPIPHGIELCMMQNKLKDSAASLQINCVWGEETHSTCSMQAIACAYTLLLEWLCISQQWVVHKVMLGHAAALNSEL